MFLLSAFRVRKWVDGMLFRRLWICFFMSWLCYLFSTSSWQYKLVGFVINIEALSLGENGQVDG